jgi:hypothetical protein
MLLRYMGSGLFQGAISYQNQALTLTPGETEGDSESRKTN